MKRCYMCKKHKDYTAFSRDRLRYDGVRAECKKCQLILGKERRKRNGEKERVNTDSIKKCVGCKIEKQTAEFTKDKGTTDGLNYYCKECCNSYKKEWRQKTKGKQREYISIKHKRCSSCGEIRNPSDYYKCSLSKDGLQYECKLCYSKYGNTITRKEYLKSYRENNKDLIKRYSAERRIRYKESEGSFTEEDIKFIYMFQGGRCAYCMKELGIKYELDHIVPFLKKGKNTSDNIALVCRACNASKGSKLLESWSLTPYFKSKCDPNTLLNLENRNVV